MDEVMFRGIVHRFDLQNDYTDNENIWVGHGSIGNLGCPDINEAMDVLRKYFGEPIATQGETPEWIKKTLRQWENAHPFQHVHERGQPLFLK